MGLRITTCKIYKNTNWLGHKIKNTGRSNGATFLRSPLLIQILGHRMSNCTHWVGRRANILYVGTDGSVRVKSS